MSTDVLDMSPEQLEAFKKGATRTIEVWHARWEDDDIRERSLSWQYQLPGENKTAPVFPDDYRHVATVITGGPSLDVPLPDALWDSYERTNNISQGWHKNPGVEAHVGPELRRSSSTGDVFVCDGTPHILTRTHFEQLGEK